MNGSEPQAQAWGFSCALVRVIARLTKNRLREGCHAHLPVGMVICAILVVAPMSQEVEAAPSLQLIAETTLESTTPLDPRPVGGLSGLSHIEGDRWMAVSDDARSPRAYELEIALNEDGSLHAEVIAVHDIKCEARDAESITRAPDGGWFVGFEFPATIVRFDSAFKNPRELAAAREAGAALQNNKGWESITLLPSDPPALLAISELGPAPSTEDATQYWRARAIFLDAHTGECIADGEYPISRPPGLGPTGLVEIAAISTDQFLALQRSLTIGRGFDGVIESVLFSFDDAAHFTITKTRIASIRDSGAAHIENVEAMAIGPTHADGSVTLMLLSDNNFGRDGQNATRIIALKYWPD